MFETRTEVSGTAVCATTSSPSTDSARGLVRPELDGGTTTAADLEWTMRELCRARRPVIVVATVAGGEVESEAVARLAAAIDVPVATLWAASRGVLSSDPRYLGSIDGRGTERANRALRAADVILIVGDGIGIGLRASSDPDNIAGCASGTRRHPEKAGVVVVLGEGPRSGLDGLLALAIPVRRPCWWIELKEWSPEPGSWSADSGALGPCRGGREILGRMVPLLDLLVPEMPADVHASGR